MDIRPSPTERIHQIHEIFEAIVKLPAVERAAFLASACGDDLALRHDVESLLAFAAIGPLNATDESDTAAAPPDLTHDFHAASQKIASADGASRKYVGPYRILEQLGEGGMGTVYKAEQRSPVRRMVALKVIKPGFDSTEVIARFESERQALARMDHPNVAKVLDAGTDNLGRPYFVMEYVPGEPITKFADDNKLTVRQRIELFTQACDAIGHAHTKALIHRDIKASNVLAYMLNGKPHLKVIDFGIAKALTGDRLTDRTFNTARGQAIGTYASMSPEQADGSPDIDTRTDVYSLGALLYELLAGVRPFDHSHFANVADVEFLRVIREVEPPRPSTRLSSLDNVTATKVAADRQSVVGSLARELRSELEWIPLKAMRKERDRRYASPAQLAEDLANYIARRPLVAGPESRTYRLRKYIGRNRARLTTVIAFLLVCGVASAAYVHGIRAEQAKTELALAEARNQRAEAEKQRLQAELWQAFYERPPIGIATTRSSPPIPLPETVQAPTSRVVPAVSESPIRPPTTHPVELPQPKLTTYEQARKQITQAADRSNWSEVLASLRAAWKAAEAESKGPDCTALVDQSLMRFRAENGELSLRRSAFPEVMQRVVHVAEDGRSGVAALVAAEALLSIEGKGPMRRLRSIDAENGFANVVMYLERAKAGSHAGARLEAEQLLLDARLGQVEHLLDVHAATARAQAEREAWGEMVATLGKGLGVIASSPAGPRQQQAAQRWRETADRSVIELRQANPDLDARRAALPNLPAELKPLADAGVYAARLALAESTIGFEGDPIRAVAKAGDLDFAGALRNLVPCISSADCPPDIKSAAVSLEWDIFAAFARRDAEARPLDSRRLSDSLRRLSRCAGMATRHADFAALLEQVLRPASNESVALRVSLAEEQLSVQESRKGLRQITQGHPAILAEVKKTLTAATEAKDVDVKARALSLLGEIAALDPAPQSLAESFLAFKSAYEMRQGEKADPVALLGLAWFYQLPDNRLEQLVAVNPQFQEMMSLNAAQRTATVMKLYRQAAFTGDMYGNFLAGQYLYIAFERTPENKEAAARYLMAAVAKGHKQAAVWLARVRADR